jgi:hypothetical protein
MQRFLNAAVRNNAPTNMNKPLPEPLVDPDEGKIPIGKEGKQHFFHSSPR